MVEEVGSVDRTATADDAPAVGRGEHSCDEYRNESLHGPPITALPASASLPSVWKGVNWRPNPGTRAGPRDRPLAFLAAGT
jgi:hypothetical protein